MEQLGCHWTDFHEILCLSTFRKSVEIIHVSLRYDKNNWFCTWGHTVCTFMIIKKKVKMVKWSRYRPGVAQRVGRGIALLFHDRSTRRGWVASTTPRTHFTPGKDPVPIVQEARWAPRPVWTGGKSRPYRDSIPDRPARSQSLYRLSYPAHRLHSSTSWYTV